MALQRVLTQAALGSVPVGSTLNVDDIDEIGLQLNGPFVGTVIFQASQDGTNWHSIAGVQSTSTSKTTGVVSKSDVGLLQFDVGCYAYFRVNMTAWTSGSATFVIHACRRLTN